MRYFLLIILCAVGFDASAQWYYKPFNKRTRSPQMAYAQSHSIKRLPAPIVAKVKIRPFTIEHTPYVLAMIEESVMKTAQHNMRFHVYNAASYNFSDLAQMYMKQNRLAEAKWFLLQSITISRQQNDDRHTIANLLDLATVKADYGDYAQAKQDLAEARQLAVARGLTFDLATVEKKTRYLQDNKFNTLHTETHFAETADAGTITKPVNK
ncbi:tetratricopeptide repeat protein [Mucilaginibacter rubeus]|uniref:Tetratricopeptide repeat protein n=1 Tax=Mucilaginibacter rubeus TaxID=2027860 RepID=A0AAE6JIN0_9SPHI|nr:MULTISPECIES: tetratricopeptide repeat protein [Mucilaginibacter]QEM06091.1 tetratricopeptide repeat protein [Mucilaginibacter rubeus]QEM18671.1 tetratricopeptide repeat protein [Mucilaginibacter gossypii]QTE44786.1 tetratricopeptide repeat protein [Mucilaginibacter rubeus]QTE51384.1 tetratricopeptide repeat protein [Mucilaginibacter rubeus]QTE56471.1 tetratricopeptide repeat protein [Mucilaginibacter rubeus]